MCWPKKIADGLKESPNWDPAVDHMSLCPLPPGCGEWVAGHDARFVGDIRGSSKRVEDRDECVDLCNRTIKCNAVAYTAYNQMCYPKYIPAGPESAKYPHTRAAIVDYFQVCPMKVPCGTWNKGHDRQGQNDIGGRQVRPLVVLECWR